jgi:peptide chain release factor subunit 1
VTFELAMTITWGGLRALAAFRAENGCAVSLYLDLDPSHTPMPADMDARINALVDEGAKLAHRAERNLSREQALALRTDVERIRAYLEELDREGTRGVAVFAASLDNLWQPLRLARAVPDAVRVNSDLYLTPLVPLVASAEIAIVAHVGREQGDLYRMQDGRLTEVADRTEDQPRRHDQGGWSQANYQRHVDSLVHGHLREVADELDRLFRRLGADAVVMAGTDDVKAELTPLLSSAVKASLAGWMKAEARATPTELQRLATDVLDGWRERKHKALLERWREDQGRGVRASAGWPETFEAASDGRIDVLLYNEGANETAWRCPVCGRIQAESGTCPLDGAELEPHTEGLDLTVHQTLAHGGIALSVSPSHDLEPVGGVGALLRY